VTDPVSRSDQLDREILAIPADRVFTKRAVAAGFAVVTVLLLAILAGVVAITYDTNRAVDRQVAPLQERNAELEDTAAVQEDLLAQSTDAIVLLLGVLQQNGIDAPEIVIRPTATTVP